MSSLRSDIAEVKADLMKWMFGAIGFQTLIILGVVLAPVKFSHWGNIFNQFIFEN